MDWQKIGQTAANSVVQSIPAVAGGLITGALNNRYTKARMEQQQEYNIGNMMLQHQYEKDNFWTQFNAENKRQDYLLANADRIKLDSMRAAGVNPAFANGAQAANTISPSMGTAASGNAGLGSVSTPDLGSYILQEQQIMKNNEVAEAQAENLKTDTFLKLYNKDANLALLWAEANHYNSGADLNRANADRVRQLTPAEVRKAYGEADWIDTQNYIALEKLPLELAQLSAEIVLKTEQANTEKAKQKESYAHANNLLAQINVYNEQVRELQARGYLEWQEADKVIKDAANAVLEGDVIKAEGALRGAMARMEELKTDTYEHMSPQERVMWERVDKATSAISDVAGAFGNILRGKAAVKSSGAMLKAADAKEMSASTPNEYHTHIHVGKGKR